MRRSAFALAGALSLALIGSTALIGTATADPRSPHPDTARATDAIRSGAVAAHRDASGRLRFVGTKAGHPLRHPAGRAAGARGDLTDFAPLFGVTDPAADLAAVSVRSVGDASVSRFQQTRHGLPVIGGQLVVTDDRNGDLLAINGAASDVTAVDTTAKIAAGDAAALATAATARLAHVPAGDLAATAPTLSIFDPELIGSPDPRPSRAVYQVTVTDPQRPTINEYVLINAATGRVDLAFSQIDGATAPTVCDFGGVAPASGDPTCPGAVQPVADPNTSPVADVSDAFALGNAVNQFYSTVLGRAGIDNADLPVVASVRYCPDTTSCPYQNAFWNGSQLIFGTGWAHGDDVFAHEYTHGVTQHTSGLLYYYQSGSINESISDVMGELFDRYNTGATAAVPTDDDSATATSQWLQGEDMPGFTGTGLRSMSNPAQSATGPQPDTMTSGYWSNDEYDAGGVHTDSGVGNKAAYLMAMGGTLGGVTATGIPTNTIAKVGAIWLGADELLTSGATYADLGNALNQSCATLLAGGVDGMTSADCQSVTAAVTATKMASAPTVGGPIAQTAACATGYGTVSAFTDSFDRASLGTAWTTSGSPYASHEAQPNTASGASMYLPDPYPDTTPTTGYAYTTNWISLSASHTSYLYFRHLDSFDWYDGSDPSSPNPEFYEGGFVDYDINGDTKSWLPLSTSTWTNGPTKSVYKFDATGNITGTWPDKGFGGDSRGWTSSRATLPSTLNGKQVKFRFRLQSDGFDYPSSAYGWWIDAMSVNSCVKAPLAPPSVAITGHRASATLTWGAANVNGGDAIKAYVVYVNAPGQTPIRTVLAASARSYTFTGLSNRVDYTFKISAVNTSGLYSPYVTKTLFGTALSVAATATSVKAGASVTLTGALTRAGNGAVLSARTVTLHSRKHGTTAWSSTTKSATTDATGHFTFKVTPTTGTDYYIEYVSNSSTAMGTNSSIVAIAVH